MIPKSGHRFSEKIMLRQGAERDDDSKKSHPALGHAAARAACMRLRMRTSRRSVRPARLGVPGFRRDGRGARLVPAGGGGESIISLD